MNKFNKTIQSLLLLLMVIMLPSCSDDNCDQPANTTPSYEMILDPKLPPCFYVITGNGIDPKNPVYLLGTNHTLGANDYSDEVRKKIESTEILISEFPELTEEKGWEEYLHRLMLVNGKFMEGNLQWFNDQFMAMGLSSDQMKKSSELVQLKMNELKDPYFLQNWYNQLTEEEKKELEVISTETGVNLLSIHPAVLPQFIYLTGEISLNNEAVEDSYEDYLIKLFSKDNKEIVYLDNSETLLWTEIDDFLCDFQDELNTSLESIKDGINTWQKVDYYAKDSWSADRYFNALDINGLISEEIDPCTNTRNNTWRKKVLRALNSGKSASIITGAYHLKGESGFLNLLKSRGYDIRPAFISKSTQEDIDKVMDFMRSIYYDRLSLEPKEETVIKEPCDKNHSEKGKLSCS